MKNLKLQLVAILVIAMFAQAQQPAVTPAAGAASSSTVDVPRLVKFNGIAKDETGKPLTGTVGATFALYKEEQGGAALWVETQNVQADSNGHYQVMLGAGNGAGLPSDIFAEGEARWLGVQIAGRAEQPRVMLASVPYALKAGDAQTIGGLPASAFLRANDSESQAEGVSQPQLTTAKAVKTNSPYGTKGYLPMWTSVNLVQNSNLFQNGSGNVGVGTASPGATLDVNGTGNFGGLVTFAAGQTVNGNVSATGVISAGSFQIGSNLFGFGSYSNDNAFLGFAGNTGVTGTGNTGVGEIALASDTSGTYNTAVGFEALLSNTTGGDNTAVGNESLALNTAGFQDTAIGVAALVYNTGSNNVAAGNWALAGANTGAPGGNNTALGAFSLEEDTSGNNNTAVGYSAGKPADLSLMTASSNSFLGAASNLTTGTLSNATAIGANAQVAQSNAMVLGSINGVNGASADTTVGIGTTTPVASGLPDGSSTKLNIVGNNTYVPLVVQSPSTFGTWILLNNSSSGGKPWAILSAASGNGEGAGNLAVTDFGAGGTIYLEGNVHVSGNLSKGGGSFQIDHPLDPANKYLYHSFVESPDMMNVYNGNVRTDKKGFATVTLPEYFEALNRDFRYQLTVMGQFAEAIVARKIDHNHFTIRTSKPGVEVSWQVTGIRHDAYADAHRIPVEVEKPASEQGRYLHPELFGAPREQAIGYQVPAANQPSDEAIQNTRR